MEKIPIPRPALYSRGSLIVSSSIHFIFRKEIKGKTLMGCEKCDKMGGRKERCEIMFKWMFKFMFMIMAIPFYIVLWIVLLPFQILLAPFAHRKKERMGFVSKLGWYWLLRDLFH